MCRVNGSDAEVYLGGRHADIGGDARRRSLHSRRLPFAFAFFLLFFSLALPRPVQAQDEWFAPDKLMHFLGGFFVTSIGYVVGSTAFDLDHDQARAAGVGAAVAASIGKEVWDGWTGRGDPSMKDLFWDGIGIGLGVVFVNRLEEGSGSPIQEGAVALGGRSARPVGPLRMGTVLALPWPSRDPFSPLDTPRSAGRLRAPRNPLTIRLRPVP